MNITTKQIKKIIKEEIESMVDEGFFDKAKSFLGIGSDGGSEKKKDYVDLTTEFLKSPMYKQKLQEAGIDPTRKIVYDKAIPVNEFFEIALMNIGKSFDIALANTVDDVMNDPPPNFKEGKANDILVAQLNNSLRTFTGGMEPPTYENGEDIPPEKIKIVLNAAIEFFHEKWATGKAKFYVSPIVTGKQFTL